MCALMSLARGDLATTAENRFSEMNEIYDRYSIAAEHEKNREICLDGLQRLSVDLEVELDNVFFLAFACACNCKEQGIITRAEFISGMTALNVYSLDELKELTKTLPQALLTDFQYLRKVYLFAFKYSLEPLEKSVPVGLCIAYWRLLLEPLGACMTEDLLAFFEEASPVETISIDLWLMIFEFTLYSCSLTKLREDCFDLHGISPAERMRLIVLTEYDKDGAWPIVLDNFIDWARQKYETITGKIST